MNPDRTDLRVEHLDAAVGIDSDPAALLVVAAGRGARTDRLSDPRR